MFANTDEVGLCRACKEGMGENEPAQDNPPHADGNNTSNQKTSIHSTLTTLVRSYNTNRNRDYLLDASQLPHDSTYYYFSNLRREETEV